MATTANEVIEEVFQRAKKEKETAEIASELLALWKSGRWSPEEINRAVEFPEKSR